MIKLGLTGLLTTFALTTLNGCSSMMSHSGPYQGYYPGTRASAEILADNQTSWALKPLALIDLPFSAVLDTLLLPWDYARSDDDRGIDSPRERVKRSEQANHTDALLGGPSTVAVNAPQP